MPYGICITLFFNNEVHDPVFKIPLFILFFITVFNWFTDLIGAHWDITCGHGIYNKVWNAFCFHHCRPEVLTLVASHVQLQALQGAQWHFWTSNLMETYEQICNYAAISK